MELFQYCLLLLPLATVVWTTPIRDQSKNVFSFLNDALDDAPAEKISPGDFAVHRPTPTSKPRQEDNSEDISQRASTESGQSHEFIDPGLSAKNLGGESRESRDALQDTSSQETKVPHPVGKAEAPPVKRAQVDTDTMMSMDKPSRQVPGHGNKERSGTHRVLVETDTARRVHIDFNSEEGVMVNGRGADHISRRQHTAVSGVQVTEKASQDISLQSKEWPGDRFLSSGEQRDLDSVEAAGGRPAAAGNSRYVDYDETREFISVEKYPGAHGA
ncbi:uncharacterized protein LOC130118664 [Lampris incognitus]|uniref:uncharacterized protein LOC130118664 n=1 Tax=Lampris incognitus TaxID=2546036 RepID=UPI0024B52CAF|nr:uncharacterized protein LOC130118664 [Lampris incognitus]